MKYLAVLASAVLGVASAAKNPTNREIVGGVPAAPGRYPWQAGFTTLQWETTFFCGGTLIAPGVVLSAAHCGTPMYIEVGCLLSADSCEQTGTSESFLNPDYLSNNVGTFNDFIVLALDRDIVSVPPIAFVADASFSEIPAGQDVTITGWGTTAAQVLSPELLEADVFVVGQETCADLYAAAGLQIDESMICAADAGKDSCQGDSGGPLFIRCDENGNDVLVGVVSWGIGCARPEFPGVYSRISHVRDWIDNVLSGLGVTLATPDVNSVCTGPSAPVSAPSPVPAPVPVTVPTVFPGWTCRPGYFGSSDGCDCNCGAPDPDCDDPDQTVYFCEAEQLCVEGLCTDAGRDVATSSSAITSTEKVSGLEVDAAIYILAGLLGLLVLVLALVLVLKR